MATRNGLSAIITLFPLILGCIGQSTQIPIRPRKLTDGIDVLEQQRLKESSEGFSTGGDESQFQRFFEVSKPITAGEPPVETLQLLYHEFADTYGTFPPAVKYTPSKGKKWNKVVLKWSAVCRGRQFDRIAGVWLGGVEIFRTCTAEPTTDGILWEIEKDVTRYASLWKKPQEVVVSLGNVVDNTYTGIINVTLSVLFYNEGSDLNSKPSDMENYADQPADVIIPISEASYENGGYWFQLSHESDKCDTSLQIPPNTYRAVLEVCISPHGNDEFWNTNPPNDYLEANNLANEIPGNGSFREVVVSIDDKVVGAVWPFVVIYTGGVNPLFWRPIAAIGAFDLPTYDIDVTPLVGSLLDGKNHTFSLTVTDALYLWLLQGNLHIWVDPKSKRTSGGLVEFSVPSSSFQLNSDFKGLNGNFTWTASRTFSYVGYVASSFGTLTTSSSYTLNFFNNQVVDEDGNECTISQLTETEGTVAVSTPEKEVALDQSFSSYPFYIYSFQTINPDHSAAYNYDIVHSLKRDFQSVKEESGSFSSLSNSQNSTGILFISVENTISGIGTTMQTLSYQSSDGCYERSVSAKNYTVLTDSSTTHCPYTAQTGDAQIPATPARMLPLLPVGQENGRIQAE